MVVENDKLKKQSVKRRKKEFNCDSILWIFRAMLSNIRVIAGIKGIFKVSRFEINGTL